MTTIPYNPRYTRSKALISTNNHPRLQTNSCPTGTCPLLKRRASHEGRSGKPAHCQVDLVRQPAQLVDPHVNDHNTVAQAAPPPHRLQLDGATRIRRPFRPRPLTVCRTERLRGQVRGTCSLAMALLLPPATAPLLPLFVMTAQRGCLCALIVASEQA